MEADSPAASQHHPKPTAPGAERWCPPCPPPAISTSDEEDDSDSSTKPIRSEKKKNPVSLFQTGGDPPKEKKTKKKGGTQEPQGLTGRGASLAAESGVLVDGVGMGLC